MSFKIATWNVNSINVRLPHLEKWCESNPTDVIALQETKVLDEKFPVEQIKQMKLQAIYAGEKQYNGVALISRYKIEDPLYELPGVTGSQKRYIAATVKGVRVINVYVPNGESLESEKYEFKLHWLECLKKNVKHALKSHKKVIILGDFNIAPADLDVYDAEIFRDRLLVSAPERDAFTDLLDEGVSDLYREKNPDKQGFSWWDYRAGSYHRDHGLRIDHMLVTPQLLEKCEYCKVDKEPRKWERPSDHTLVVASFDI